MSAETEKDTSFSFLKYVRTDKTMTAISVVFVGQFILHAALWGLDDKSKGGLRIKDIDPTARVFLGIWTLIVLFIINAYLIQKIFKRDEGSGSLFSTIHMLGIGTILLSLIPNCIVLYVTMSLNRHSIDSLPPIIRTWNIVILWILLMNSAFIIFLNRKQKIIESYKSAKSRFDSLTKILMGALGVFMLGLLVSGIIAGIIGSNIAVYVFAALVVFTLMVIFGVYYRKKIQQRQQPLETQRETPALEDLQPKDTDYKVREYLCRNAIISITENESVIVETVLEVEEENGKKYYYRENVENRKDSTMKLYEKINFLNPTEKDITYRLSETREYEYFIQNPKSDLLLLKLDKKPKNIHVSNDKLYVVMDGVNEETELQPLKEVILSLHRLQLCAVASPDQYIVTKVDSISNNNDSVQVGTLLKSISSNAYEIISHSNENTCQNDKKIDVVVLKTNGGTLKSLSKSPSTFSFFYDDETKTLYWSSDGKARQNIKLSS